MTKEGIDLVDLENKLRKFRPKLIYVMPNIQNPTGISYTCLLYTSILRLSAMQYLDITESQYPVVTLNELSWQVLRGQKKVWQKMVIVKKAKAKGELFEALRSLRKELATKEKLPPYMIFSDATLTQMARCV